MPSTIHLDQRSEQSAVAPMFCHLCGRALVRGRCTEHSPRKHRTIYASVVVGAVFVAAVGFGVRSTQNGRDVVKRLDGVESALEDAHAAIKRLDKGAAAASGAAQVAGSRIADVEAKVDALPDPTKVAEAVLASVATVQTPAAKGSAFVFSSEDSRAMLVTNYHVIGSVWDLGQRGVTVRLGGRTYEGQIERVSTAGDLALVSVQDRLPPLAPSVEEPKAGQSIRAVGSPRELDNTITDGVISAVRVYEGLPYLQISAEINPGNSGGPLVDAFGRVVGVVVKKRYDVEGVAFAIPLSTVCTELKVGCP